MPLADSLTPAQAAAATQLGIEPAAMSALLSKKIFDMTPAEVDRYVAFAQVAEPDFRSRIAMIGRNNIGQRYKLNLLGEFPFEQHDDLPMFSLSESDCVVFVEHTYAMALSRSWDEFFWMLQRIRYDKGVIGVRTRNHYTELDWNINNAWLVQDITATLAGDRLGRYSLTVDRSAFLKKRHKTLSNIPVQVSEETYLPYDMVSSIATQLSQGDYVNVISTRDGAYWASHVGMVVIDAQGRRNFLNSSEPRVIEESFDAFIGRTLAREARNDAAGKNAQKLAGFKFLRLNDAPMVPPMAPQPRPNGPN